MLAFSFRDMLMPLDFEALPLEFKKEPKYFTYEGDWRTSDDFTSRVFGVHRSGANITKHKTFLNRL